MQSREDVVAVMSSWSQNVVWAVTLGAVALLGGLVVVAPSLSALFTVPVLLAAWFGGPALPALTVVLSSVAVVWAQLLLPSPSPGAMLVHSLVFAFAAVAGGVARRELERVSQVAHVDPLTGVLSRARFYELAERELVRARRSGLPISVAFLDVDGLKALNDGQGHAAGDEALKLVGAVLRSTVRAVDLVGRVGGDEFVLVLPDTSGPAAQLVLGRVRARLAAEAKRGGPAVSVSGGVSCHALPIASAQDLVAEADRAMYAQKRRSARVPVHVFAAAK